MKKQTILLWFFILCLPAALHYGLRSLVDDQSSEPSPSESKTYSPSHEDHATVSKDPNSAPSVPLRSETTPEDSSKNPSESSVRTSSFQANIQKWNTKGGANVYFIQNNTLPMVDITLSFDAGSSRDAEHPGLAALWLNLLNQGTTDLNADQIAEQFENTGALFDTNLDKDRVLLTLRSLSDPKILATLIDLLAGLITTPAFSESSIASIKAQQLIHIQQKQQQPNAIAQDAFYTAIYGEHPYAHPGLGTEKTIASLGAQELRAFHTRYAVAKNATITLVGNLELEEAKALTEKLMQRLPAGTPAPALAAVQPLKTSSEQRIPFEAEQTHIMMGAPCIATDDPDFFALALGNYILGENGLSSELFNEIREKRGLAYHVGSRLIPLKEPGPFVIKLQTKHTQTQEAIECVKETLRRFLKEGPSEEAVEEAKDGLIRAFPLGLNNNAKLSDKLSTIAFYGLPVDFMDTYQQKIQSLTHTQVKAALQKHLDPEKMALIVVGPQS